MINKILFHIAPGKALDRIRNQQAFAAYQAAKPSRTHKVQRSTGSADTQVERAANSIKDQARHLEENNDLIDGLLSVMVNHIIGKDGISVEPMPLNYDGEIDTDFAKTLSQGFAEWSLKPDSTGEYTRPELERLACRTWLRDGEVFGEHLIGTIPSFKHPNGEVPFSIQALEPDFVPVDLNNSKNLITQGIQHNRWNQPTHYHVFTAHPGDHSVWNTDTRPVISEQMMHVKMVNRLHQKRGVSILASSFKRISGLENYEESELVAARIAAAMAFYIRKGGADDYSSEDKPDNQRRNLPISPGTIFDDLKPGEDVGTIVSNRPNALLQTFRDAMFRAVCSATGANASTVSKKYDGTYSSQRQELVESFVSYGVLSNKFIGCWSRPTYRQYVRMAVLSGKVKVPAHVNPSTIFNAYYQPPVMPWIDPFKEAKGYSELVQSGFATESEVVRSRNKNPTEVKKQRAREVAENREAGLVFSSDQYHKYYGKSAESNQPEQGQNNATEY